LHVPHTCGRGLSVFGGGNEALLVWAGSALAVWAEATRRRVLVGQVTAIDVYAHHCRCLYRSNHCLMRSTKPLCSRRLLQSCSKNYRCGIHLDLALHAAIACRGTTGVRNKCLSDEMFPQRLPVCGRWWCYVRWSAEGLGGVRDARQARPRDKGRPRTRTLLATPIR
jgi:hypothetical protein